MSVVAVWNLWTFVSWRRPGTNSCLQAEVESARRIYARDLEEAWLVEESYPMTLIISWPITKTVLTFPGLTQVQVNRHLTYLSSLNEVDSVDLKVEVRDDVHQ